MSLSETERMNLTFLLFIAKILFLHCNKRKSLWMRDLISKSVVLRLFVSKNGEHTSKTITSLHWWRRQKLSPKRLPTLNLTGSRTPYLVLRFSHLRVCFSGKKQTLRLKYGAVYMFLSIFLYLIMYLPNVLRIDLGNHTSISEKHILVIIAL
jgi:hypothetical protein